jgi:CheY-like chemotaxis protein
MDVEMPGRDGMTATEGLRSSIPQRAVGIRRIEDDVHTRAQAAGAARCVEKRGAREGLRATIRQRAKFTNQDVNMPVLTAQDQIRAG